MAIDNLEALRDRHLDCLLELAFAMERREDGPADRTAGDGELCHRTWAAFERKLRVRRRARLRRKARKLLEVAACLAVAAAIVAPIALSTSAAFRSRVLKLLVEPEKEYTALRLAEDPGAAFDVPAEWEGDWYPSYIPERFNLIQIGGFHHDVFFQDLDDGAGGRLSFFEWNEDAETNIDTEGAEIRHVTVNGRETMIIRKGNTINAVWSAEDRYFLLTLSEDRKKPDEAEFMRILEGIRRIVR